MIRDLRDLSPAGDAERERINEEMTLGTAGGAMDL